jgi:hypothetical protein
LLRRINRDRHVLRGGHATDKSVTILDPRRLFGQEGEAEAERYLRRKGYRIVAKNLRSSLGELDSRGGGRPRVGLH